MLENTDNQGDPQARRFFIIKIKNSDFLLTLTKNGKQNIRRRITRSTTTICFGNSLPWPEHEKKWNRIKQIIPITIIGAKRDCDT